MNMIERIANYIDGRLEAPRSGCYIDNIEPATGQVYSLTPDSDAADLEQAMTAADRAFPEWSALSAEERARLLLGIADRIEAADRAARPGREHRHRQADQPGPAGRYPPRRGEYAVLRPCHHPVCE